MNWWNWTGRWEGRWQALHRFDVEISMKFFVAATGDPGKLGSSGGSLATPTFPYLQNKKIPPYNNNTGSPMASKPTPAATVAKKKLPALVVPGSFGANCYSVLQMQTQLGRDRGTIMRWINAGCPVVQKADQKTRQDWVLNLGDVVKWREQQIAREAVQKRADDGEAYDDPKDLVSLARMQMKLEEERRQLVKLAWAITVLQRCLGLVRQSVMALPLRFLDLMPGIDTEEYARIHTSSVDLCVDALVDAQKEIKDFMAAATRKGGLVDEDEEAADVSPAS